MAITENEQLSLPLVWNESLEKILGRLCFQCVDIASILRLGGAAIPYKAEAEQARVLHYLLCMYAKHGEEWVQRVHDDLYAIRSGNGGIQ